MEPRPFFSEDGACLVIELEGESPQPDRFALMASRIINQTDDCHDLHLLAICAVRAYSGVAVLARTGTPHEVAKWSTPFFRSLIFGVERLSKMYREQDVETHRLLCRANDSKVVRYAGGAGLDYIDLTTGLLRDRLGQIRRLLCPETEGIDENADAWKSVTMEAVYDRWPEIRALLASCPAIEEAELKRELLAELYRYADHVEAPQGDVLKLQQSAMTKTVEDEVQTSPPATSPSLRPTPPRRMPDKKAWAAHFIRVTRGITNQKEIADEMTRNGMPIGQGTVSRKLKQMDAYLAAGGTLLTKDEIDQMDTVDPKVIDMGPRQDGRTPKQRIRKAEDSDE